MNEFSILCRVLGSLYHRPPQDPILTPLFALLREGTLRAQWPLEQDALLQRLEQNAEPAALAGDYAALFVGEQCAVPPCGSQWPNGPQEAEVRAFLTSRGMSLGEAPADHIGQLLLAASWLEDQSQEDEYAAQVRLFDSYLLPWCGTFLGKLEAHAQTPFYRALAGLSREAIQAMREELAEVETAAADRGA
ncbi:molecular chaperone [Pantoea sp. 1.19]|uniref:TorD/DmsD family molecular chaperone n=1 Tax=Pantoea sp. 1.19 TaxID=1925589 RepID=UPI00094892ED|nr:molecular chaperone [Pantoea sp. 1.19]